MRKVRTLLVLGASFIAASALAAVHPFPSAFKTQFITVNGARIYVRVGGHGPAVVLLHGYGETGDMWEPLAATLEPNRVTKLVLMDAPLPGVGPWDEILKSPLL
jgi:hypothetical protein